MNNQNLLGKNVNIGVAGHCNELQIANNFSLANIFSWEGEVLVCLYCKKLRNLQNFQDFHLANRNYQGMAFALFQAIGAPCANLYTWSRFVTKFQSFSRSVSPKSKLKLRLELSLDNLPINRLQWLTITTRWYINGIVSNADDQQHLDDQQTGADPHEDDHVSHQQLQRPRCKWAPAPQWTRQAPPWSMRHIVLLVKIIAAPTIISSVLTRIFLVMIMITHTHCFGQKCV